MSQHSEKANIRVVIDCVLTYAKVYAKEELFKNYVTDALQVLTGNTAKFAGGKEIKKRYIKLCDKMSEKPKNIEDTKKDVDAMLKRMGIKLK